MTENFNGFGLNNALIKALTDEGYETPTPIQTQAIPYVMQGRDLLGIAQTGTGKTAAFALPILHNLAENRRPAPRQGCRVLILAPTRELASQIAQSFRTYGRHMGVTVATVFGGVSYRPQIAQTRNGVDVLVATPGRLIDHLDERHINLAGTEILVLDEADQMLDMGFIRPIKRILKEISVKRQNLFFSATMTPETSALAAEILRNPAEVAVTPRAKTADRVAQQVIHIEAPKKRALLVELFGNPAMNRAIIFTRTKRGADRVARHLDDSGIKVSAIHGNKSQGQRDAALTAFKAGRIRALVATDIAARGIDIDEVSHVVNYELPNLPESYVHRIGRTARAGAEGIAISLCDADERAYLRSIEKLIRQSIPSSNRCGDASLIVTEPRPGSRDERAEDGERQRGGRSDQRRGGGGRGQPRAHAARGESNAQREPRKAAEAWTPESQDAAPKSRSKGGRDSRPADGRGGDARRGECRAADGRGGDARNGEGRRPDANASRHGQPQAGRVSRAAEGDRATDSRRSDGRRPDANASRNGPSQAARGERRSAEPVRFGAPSRSGGGAGKKRFQAGGHAPAR